MSFAKAPDSLNRKNGTENEWLLQRLFLRRLHERLLGLNGERGGVRLGTRGTAE